MCSRPITAPGSTGGRAGDMELDKWQPPMAGVVKINVDARAHMQDDWRGMELVARDERGSFIAGRSIWVRGRFAASTTEALAVREAVIWAGQAGWSSVFVESDALSVVQGIATSDGIAYEDSIFAKIRHMIASFANLSVHFVKRSANRVAHTLAQRADSESDCLWVGTPPDCIVNLLRFDC
ncbi:unnamed protein product [Cuscuta epithymum]|nr:unnamed protein product [Cuscuta epithymum]